ncbi:MAG: hypothetical protein IJY42_05475, partial [Clostridia bacterium]|nr:hypothetical protein [Clostridia bacterium]
MKRLLACLLAVLLGLSALIGCAEEPAGDENIVYANGLELTPDEDKTYYTYNNKKDRYEKATVVVGDPIPKDQTYYVDSEPVRLV